MKRIVGTILATAILGCDRSQPPAAVPKPPSSAPGLVAPGTALAEGDFRKALQAIQAKYFLATVFAAD